MYSCSGLVLPGKLNKVTVPTIQSFASMNLVGAREALRTPHWRGGSSNLPNSNTLRSELGEVPISESCC